MPEMVRWLRCTRADRSRDSKHGIAGSGRELSALTDDLAGLRDDEDQYRLKCDEGKVSGGRVAVWL